MIGQSCDVCYAVLLKKFLIECTVRQDEDTSLLPVHVPVLSSLTDDYETKSARWANEVLAACREQADKAGVISTTIHVGDTDPDKAIVETAKTRGCDLIVMASHGRGPIGRLLLGSVALKVLTYTSVTVQIVR